MCQLRGVENGSSVFGGLRPQVVRAQREVVEDPRVDRRPAPAQASQSAALARRCTWTSRLTSAEAIGRASALSVARLPAPMTIEPAGSSYAPMRRSRISE